MVKTIKFSDFMDKSYKKEVLTQKEVDTYDTVKFLAIMALTAFVIANLPVATPLLAPHAVNAFLVL